MNRRRPGAPTRDVAIVGMACRFPGARDLAAYRRLVERAEVSIGPVPPERWTGAFDAQGADPQCSYTDVGAFLPDVTSFPARHFGMSARRAQVLDPQQRLLLDVVREALEDAGLDANRDRSCTGVFVGASSGDFQSLLTTPLRAAQMSRGSFGGRPDEALGDAVRELVHDIPPPRPFTMTGTLRNMVAAVVAQAFDFRGPSFVVDAACSSSLLALHEAVLHLRAGTCDLAVVGGVHVNLVPDAMVGFSRIGAISRSGRCRPFDEAADGFVLGEGAGAVVLQRSADALAEARRVYVLVKGSGASNDGRAGGPMAPDVDGQVLALRRAYDDAEVDPSTIGFVETHGTATAVGDATELAGLSEVLPKGGPGGPGASVCWLSSVKANIGHTMAAAGVAGLIKAALVLSDGVVPPQPAPFAANPALGLGTGLFDVATQPQPWPSAEGARRGAVSSFGFGGSNAHVVLEAPAAVEPDATSDARADADRPALVVVSAAERALLADHAERLAECVQHDPRATPAGVARAAAMRPRRRHRLAVVAATKAELADRLRAAATRLRAEPPERMPASEGCWYGEHDPKAPPGPLTFVYPGQGAQRVGALQDLDASVPTFRRRTQQLDAVVEAATGVSPLAHLYAGATEAAAASPGAVVQSQAEAGRRLARTQVCQPALAIHAVALTELLAAVGLRPGQVLGHSVGELCAAGAAGVIEAVDLVRLVARRGRLMAEHEPAQPGAMLAVNAGEAETTALLEGLSDVWVANLNGPRQVVVSGHASAVAVVQDRASSAGLRTTPLEVSHAFHSPLVASAAAALLPSLRELDVHAGERPVFSAVTGQVYGPPNDIREVLERHAVSPVDFVSAVRALEEHVSSVPGTHAVVHVGPGRTGLGLVRAALRDPDRVALVALADDEPDEARTFLGALGALAVLGHPVDLGAAVDAVTGADTGPAREARHTSVVLPPVPLPTQSYPLPGGSRSGSPRIVTAPRVARSRTPARPTPDPTLSTGEAMTDLVTLFREQTALLRMHLETQQPAALVGSHDRGLPTGVGGPDAPAAVTAAPVSTAATASADQSVLQAVARISGYPAQTLQPSLTLVDDLGFDSIMVAELVSQLRGSDPSAAALAEGLTRHTSIGDVIALMATSPAGAVSSARPAEPLPDRPVAPVPGDDTAADTVVAESTWRIEQFPEVAQLGERLNLQHELRLRNPYFSLHERVVNDTSLIAGREMLNFSSYNYLGMSGDPTVSQAAQAAIDRYGTSVSASRLISGDKPVHRELEAALAQTLGTEDAVVLVSGHATNVTVISSLVGPGDLVLHDALAHDSIMQGCRLSGAVRRPFPHGDCEALDAQLRQLRSGYRRVLVAVEGVYSMDGDIPDLPEFIAVKRRHGALLYVDEAHSFGTIGATGRGIGEHFGVDPADVDVWMGTLSKSLASCGGYIGGSRALVQLLKYTAAGFIYSVGIPAPSAAASLAALRLMLAEPERVQRLRDRSRLFLTLARDAGLDTGLSRDTAVVPCVVGDSVKALRLADALFSRGINVNPILYPAVEEDQARLRFFLTACHSEEQIRHTVDVLAEEVRRLDAATTADAARAVSNGSGPGA